MVWKIVIVVVAAVLVLLAATAFWTYILHGNAGFAINMADFKLLALRSPWYQGTALVIVGIAGCLLWYWLRAQPH